MGQNASGGFRPTRKPPKHYPGSIHRQERAQYIWRVAHRFTWEPLEARLLMISFEFS